MYFASDDWLNFDFDSLQRGVISADLTSRIPTRDSFADLVYTSHLIEHFTKIQALSFLSECFRVMRPGALIRIVTPDLENIVRKYIEHIDQKNYVLSHFEVILLLDQICRTESGGDYRLLREQVLKTSDAEEYFEYLYSRTGEHLYYGKDAFINTAMFQSMAQPLGFLVRKYRKLTKKIIGGYFRILTSLTPKAFLHTNLSMTKPGERHLWIYDEYSLRDLLFSVGFTRVARVSFDQTHYSDKSILLLDRDEKNSPRKGTQSMYIEAFKEDT